MGLLTIADDLAHALRPMRFASPVEYVYNPLDYARAGHAAYIGRYGEKRREVILLGMNPGPWGMAQTGVPFGEVGLVRDWLGIDVAIDRPRREHPARPVQGFACPRSEVSGARLWGWARDTFGTPQRLFDQFFVANYCPLMFLEGSGRNRTPDKLFAQERLRLEAVCDQALRRPVEHLKPRMVVGVGGFAERCSRRALSGMDVTVGRVLHPSPASPRANRGWAAQANRELRDLGISIPE